jgi:hypothetical protein
MPSTYTLNNGIELIGTGEQSGTWGDTTNTNLGLLDAALDGQVTVALASAGSSGSPNSLPITDGTASNGRNRMVVFSDSGDLGATAYVQLTPNDAEKIIYIRNSLSGSRSVILFQGTYNASNDYEVPAGTTAVVYFDGAGAGAVAANVFNNAYFDGLRLGSVSVTAILDEDNMASDSAAALATQQSIKAYVDSQVGTVDTLAEILAIGNTTGATDIAVDSAQKVQFRDAAIYINSSVDGQLDIVADTEIQIAATTVDLNGALDVSGTLGVTGVLTATSLDISGDIDVDGTTNLDAVDIDGATQIDATVTVGIDDTGYDVKFFGATTGKSLLWDESADSLIVTGTTTLVGTTNLDAVDIDGATQIDATVTVGVDDTGYDVKFFGATAGAYMLWDESADDLILGGAAGLSVNSAALVTGVLTTTAATVSNGGGQFNGGIVVGVDDTGYDVKFFGATAGAYMLWDESADDLILGGAAGLSVNSAALVTGVLTTTAATVSNGGGQFNGAINVGVDDTGYDVKFFGATAGKYMLWDESADTLEVSGTVVADGLKADSPLNTLSGLELTYLNATKAIFSLLPSTGEIRIGGTETNYFPTFYSSGTEAMRIDSSQRVLIGATSTRTVDGYNQHLLLEGAGITKSSFAMVTHTNDANGAYFYLSKARGTTIGGSTIVQDGDVSGAIVFTAADGTDMTSKVAQIQANVDGTPGSNDTPGSLQFYTTADGASSVTERMRIDDNGNVRINNGAGANFTVDDDNSRSLTVAAASNANAMYVAHSSGRGVGYFGYDGGGDRLIIACDNGSGSNSIQFSVNAGSSSDTNNVDGIAAAMTIDSSGRLGLGITPSATTAFTVFQNKYLSLYGFDQAQSHILTNTYYPVDNGDYKRQATGHALKLSMNSGSYIFNIGASGAADSVITFNPAMTLDPSGNLLVNRTSGLGSAKFVVEQDTTTANPMVVSNSRSTAATDYSVLFYRNGSIVGSVQTSLSATSYVTSSDYRLKTDAQPMTGASARVQALKPVNFEWISSGERVDGFLAHEAQEVVPECVTGTKDAMRDEEYEVTAAIAATYDEDGNELTAAVEAVMGTRSVPDMQGIDQSKLVPLLTAALQEALTEISALKVRVTALENA